MEILFLGILFFEIMDGLKLKLEIKKKLHFAASMRENMSFYMLKSTKISVFIGVLTRMVVV